MKKAYLILTNRELTKIEVEKALNGIKDLATSSNSSTNSIASPEESTSSTEKSEGYTCNGINGAKLNFDQFCCIMSELIHHRYRNSVRNNASLPAGKTEYFVKNISSVLTRLLGKHTTRIQKYKFKIEFYDREDLCTYFLNLLTLMVCRQCAKHPACCTK